MWVLVVGKEALVSRPDGAVSTLEDLGCRVRTLDLWDNIDAEDLMRDPPTAVLVEAMDEVDAGRAALQRLRGVTPLTEVPIIAAVTVNAIARLDMGDGFDDFVLCPYVPPELYARLRRAEYRKSEFEHDERMKIGDLVIDLAAHEVSVEGGTVELTHQEFALLKFLATHRGRVFTRDQLLQRVWGVDYYGGSRTVDIHVRRLRAKLGHASRPIETVRGVGYKLRAQ